MAARRVFSLLWRCRKRRRAGTREGQTCTTCVCQYKSHRAWALCRSSTIQATAKTAGQSHSSLEQGKTKKSYEGGKQGKRVFVFLQCVSYCLFLTNPVNQYAYLMSREVGYLEQISWPCWNCVSLCHSFTLHCQREKRFLKKPIRFSFCCQRLRWGLLSLLRFWCFQCFVLGCILHPLPQGKKEKTLHFSKSFHLETQGIFI